MKVINVHDEPRSVCGVLGTRAKSGELMDVGDPGNMKTRICHHYAQQFFHAELHVRI